MMFSRSGALLLSAAAVPGHLRATCRDQRMRRRIGDYGRLVV